MDYLLLLTAAGVLYTARPGSADHPPGVINLAGKGHPGGTPLSGYETGYAAPISGASGNQARNTAGAEEDGGQADANKDQQEAAQDEAEGDDDATGEDEDTQSNSSESSQSSESESESEEPMVNVYVGGKPGSAIPAFLLKEIGPLPDPKIISSLRGAQIVSAPKQAYPVQDYDQALGPAINLRPVTLANGVNYNIRLVPPAVGVPHNGVYPGHEEAKFPSFPSAGSPVPNGANNKQLWQQKSPENQLATEELVPQNILNNSSTRWSPRERIPTDSEVFTPEESTTVRFPLAPTLKPNPGIHVSHPIRFYKRSVTKTPKTRHSARKNTQERLKPRRTAHYYNRKAVPLSGSRYFKSYPVKAHKAIFPVKR